MGIRPPSSSATSVPLAGGTMTGEFILTIILPDGGGTVSMDATLQGVVKTS